jgi:hypothetical protein
MVCALLLVLAGNAAAQAPRGAQLTEQQATQVRQLVRRTRAEVERLETLLSQRREQLAEAYMRYELRSRAALALQDEIVRLQRDLLAVHHRMHAHLRTIVTKEQFETMKRRVSTITGGGTNSMRSSSGK